MGAPTTYIPVTDGEPLLVDLGDDGLVYEPVDAAVDRAREDRSRRVIVLAPTAQAATWFRREHGLLERQVIYATEASIRGYTDVDVVVLEGWRHRRDAERIWHSLLPAWICRPRSPRV